MAKGLSILAIALPALLAATAFAQPMADAERLAKRELDFYENNRSDGPAHYAEEWAKLDSKTLVAFFQRFEDYDTFKTFLQPWVDREIATQKGKNPHGYFRDVLNFLLYELVDGRARYGHDSLSLAALRGYTTQRTRDAFYSKGGTGLVNEFMEHDFTSDYFDGEGRRFIDSLVKHKSYYHIAVYDFEWKVQLIAIADMKSYIPKIKKYFPLKPGEGWGGKTNTLEVATALARMGDAEAAEYLVKEVPPNYWGDKLGFKLLLWTKNRTVYKKIILPGLYKDYEMPDPRYPPMPSSPASSILAGLRKWLRLDGAPSPPDNYKRMRLLNGNIYNQWEIEYWWNGNFVHFREFREWLKANEDSLEFR
jgi:hypothetical protein